MNSIVYVLIAVGVFLVYLAVLFFRRKISKIWPLLCLAAGIFTMVYAVTDMRNENGSADAENTTIDIPEAVKVDNNETTVEVTSGEQAQNSRQSRFFEGDPVIGKEKATIYYAKAVNLWNKTYGGYRKPDSVKYYTDQAIYYYPLAEAFNVRGQVNVQMGQIKEAVQDYKEAILLDSTQAEPHFNMGAAYYIMNNFGEACDCWRKAGKLGMLNAQSALNKYCE